MTKLELVVRYIRLPFLIAFAAAAYLAVLSVSKGWHHTFLFVMLWPFIVATLVLEFIEIAKLNRAKK
jgi:uncharacterized membrane protein (DUF485 family)